MEGWQRVHSKLSLAGAGYQPVQTAVVGVLTGHSLQNEATIWNAPQYLLL